MGRAIRGRRRAEAGRALFETVFRRDGGRCTWCGRPVQRVRVHRGLPTDAATLDHLTPRAHGGPLSPDNLVLACFACNNARGDMPAEDFAEQRGIGPGRLARPEAPLGPEET